MDGPSAFIEDVSMGETLQMLDESIQKRQQAIEKLQREIDAHQAALLPLKSRRNNLIPIASFPPEILGKIFSFVQMREFDYMGRRTNHPLDWVALTHVCSRWRDVALDIPTLWVDLPIEYPEWVEEMARRSKECGLMVNADVPESADNQQGFISAFEEIHRIKELSLFCSSSNAWNVAHGLFSLGSAPQLEQFSLNARDFPIMVWHDIFDKTDRLRQLELVNCLIDWNLHPLLRCPLTHLKLVDLSPGCMPTGKKFLEVLKGLSPTLQTLELIQSLPSRTEEGSSSWESENIHLGHLQTLRIDSMPSELEDFFLCVTFPPGALASAIFLDEVDGDYSAAFIAFARSYSNAAPVFQSLFLEPIGPDGGILLKLYTKALPDLEIVDIAHFHPAQLEMQFHYSEYVGSWAAISTQLMSDIFNSDIDLRNIRHVYIQTNLPGIPPDLLAMTLGKLPSLHSVVAAGFGARTLVNAMRVVPHVESVVGDHVIDPVYFPHVTSMFLHEATFVEPHLLDESGYPDELSTELLQDLLSRRQELGVPIQTLVLQESFGVSLNDIKMLEEFVINILWDEKGGEHKGHALRPSWESRPDHSDS